MLLQHIKFANSYIMTHVYLQFLFIIPCPYVYICMKRLSKKRSKGPELIFVWHITNISVTEKYSHIATIGSTLSAKKGDYQTILVNIIQNTRDSNE